MNTAKVVLTGSEWRYDMEPDYTVISSERLSFYIVLRDLNKPNATKRHETLMDAQEEAMRLSRKEKAAFHVCKVMPRGYMEPEEIPVKWTPV